MSWINHLLNLPPDWYILLHKIGTCKKGNILISLYLHNMFTTQTLKTELYNQALFHWFPTGMLSYRGLSFPTNSIHSLILQTSAMGFSCVRASFDLQSAETLNLWWSTLQRWCGIHFHTNDRAALMYVLGSLFVWMDYAFTTVHKHLFTEQHVCCLKKLLLTGVRE